MENTNKKEETNNVFNINFNRITFLRAVFIMMLALKLMGEDVSWFQTFLPLIIEFGFILFGFIIWSRDQIKKNFY